MTESWISVDDRLPEGTQDCIICVLEGDGTKCVTTGTYEGRYKMWRVFAPCRVTHWMPFPELPKEESNNG